MQETVYFYSRDGTDSHGPVTHDELCQLIRENVIGSHSYYCHEGETKWRTLDPDFFVRPPGTTRLPPYEPPPYVPPVDARQRDEERVAQLQHGWEDIGPYPGFLSAASFVLVIASTVILQLLRHNADGVVGYIGAAVIVGLLPGLIALPFKLQWKRRVYFISVVVCSALAIAVQVKLNAIANAAPVDPNAPAAPSADLPPTPPPGN